MISQLFDGFTYNTPDILWVTQYFSLPFEARSIELKKPVAKFSDNSSNADRRIIYIQSFSELGSIFLGDEYFTN